ncbi:MAG: hypothetical protein ACKVU4_00515 [Phycisphaerales bacterium]
MRHKSRRAAVVGALVLAALGQGCAYYEVTDPGSGRKYYTNNWQAKRQGPVGTVQFKDARTGKFVTLQSSEVRQISEGEYSQALGEP